MPFPRPRTLLANDPEVPAIHVGSYVQVFVCPTLSLPYWFNKIMGKKKDRIQKIYSQLFNEHRKEQMERFFLFLALGGFIIHAMLVYLIDFELIQIDPNKNPLLDNVISAIYTPFSFILIYEVLLLVYYLPSSFSTSIAKQYEIVSLIILRRVFKDIAKLNLESDDWSDVYHLNLLVDMLGVLLIIVMIYVFFKMIKNRPQRTPSKNINQFILIKKAIAIFMIPAVAILATFSLVEWILEVRDFNMGLIKSLGDVNSVFYHEFFNFLILVDVSLLIISMFFTNNYSYLIRNSGFVVSTVLIRLSFSYDGWQNTALIFVGVSFGVIIQWLYNIISKTKVDLEET